MRFGKTLSLILLIVLCITIAAPAVYATEERVIYFENTAEMLKSIGIFKGTDKGFELDRRPTRSESAVIIVRLLGKETEALQNNYEHPFSDVQEWADPYVGYLYKYNITSGISNTEYGSNNMLDEQQCVTLLLRVLGYNDKIGDFQWDKSLEKAVEINLVSENFAKAFDNEAHQFIRDDVVYLLNNALDTKLKDSENTLMEKLIADNVFTLDQAIDSGLYKKSIKVEGKGIIIRSSDDPIKIETMTDGNKWFYYADENDFVTVLSVFGNDLKEYKLFLQKDNGIDKDSLVGKSITFTGDLAFDMYNYDNVRYIDLEDYTITSLHNDDNYEPVAFKGKLLPNYHLDYLGGLNPFPFITEENVEYTALMGIHTPKDYEEAMALAEAEGAYVYYSLDEYIDVDIWLKGYRLKDTTIIIVTEFAREYALDEDGQWIKLEQIGNE